MHSNVSQNLLLHQALYNHTISAVKNTGLPYILIDEAVQQGNNFGEKYCNALEFCFNNGFEKIISIGSDCATLTTENLLRAEHSSYNKNLIGADENGGFYLFALQRKNYCRQNFLAFKWSTNKLIHDIFSYFEKTHLTAPILLQKEKDINSATDLIRIFKMKKLFSFINLLIHLFNKVVIEIKEAFSKLSNLFLHIFLLRGPPSVLVNSL